MKKPFTYTLSLGLLTACLVLLSSFRTPDTEVSITLLPSGDALKKEAFTILNTKCNVCHRKKNPFMVFNEKNMSKRAKKIYQMVYVQRKMPKGTDIKLTNEEYFTLEKWLFTQNIY